MSTAAAPRKRPSPRRVAIAAFTGQAIEFYDFYLYGTAATVVLGHLFFPSDDPLAESISAFATFAAGFLLRPIGGILFGHLGDRIGRRKTLMITLFMMGGATFLMGCLPTYGEVGALAPILLVVLRCVQGLGIGGEWGGASLIAVEHAPKGKAAFYGSITQLGSPAGLLLSTLMLLLFGLLPEEQFHAWGWRVPFLFAGILLLVAYMIRRQLHESPEFERVSKADRKARVPLVEVFRGSGRWVVIGIAAALLTNAGYYLVNTFTITYVTTKLGLPSSVGLVGQLLTGTAQGLLLLFVGLWANRLGARTLATAGAGLVALWAFPLYALMNVGAPPAIWFGQVVATIFQTGLWAVLPALLASQFPVHLRYTALSLCYQGCSVIGGFAPMAATYLLSISGGASWPVATLLCVVATTSAIGAFLCRRPRSEVEVPDVEAAVRTA